MLNYANYSKCFILSILFVCSCSSKKSDFSENEKYIYGQVIETGCLVGKATEIVCIDSLLLYYDRYANQTITLFDTKNNRLVGRYLSTGNGPGEVLAPLKLFVSPTEGKIYIFQIQKGSLHECSVKEAAEGRIEAAITEKLIFEDRPAFLKRAGNHFVGIGVFDDSRFHLYASNGELIASVGKYPFGGEEMPSVDRFILYQGALCTSPGGDYFAMGSSYCDNLEFYRIEEKGASLIQKYGASDVKASFSQQIKIQDDCVMNYKCAYGTDKYCYMLYSGKTYAENGRRTHGGQRIIMFDWNGKYIKSFVADKNIVSFCVNEKNDIMYATVEDNDFSIMCFQL